MAKREVFFLDAAFGQRFCMVHRPAGKPRGLILHLHPFAEELNKTRRMSALGARTFADEGWLVLQIDLLGCGDSSGDFADASWSGWLADVSLGTQWLRAQSSGPLLLWGVRAGALLATSWLCAGSQAEGLLLWQPVASGRLHLQQFLRLHSVSQMLGDSNAGVSVSRLRDELAAGRVVEVAGYGVSPALGSGLEAATMSLPATFQGMVHVLELSGAETLTSSAAVQLLAADWSKVGVEARCETLRGPAFWTTQEIVEVPELIHQSCKALGAFHDRD